jgi:hypothetical protein
MDPVIYYAMDYGATSTSSDDYGNNSSSDNGSGYSYGNGSGLVNHLAVVQIWVIQE